MFRESVNVKNVPKGLENQIPVSLELPKWEQMALMKRL